MMMKAAKDLKKQHPKPVGAPKQDSLGQKCEWNFEKGRWEADPKKQPKGWVVNPKDPTKYVDPNAPPTVTRGPGRPRTAPADDEEVPAPPPKKQKQDRRVVQPGWRTTLPSLLVSRRSVGTTVETTETFVCPSGVEDCPGCSVCSVLKCSKCLTMNTPGKGSGDNPFVVGCGKFHMETIRNHAIVYHPEFASNQTNIVRGFEKQLADSQDLIRILMTNALWLAIERIPLRKFKSLAQCMRANGLRFGKLYCNEMMARDMLDALASVVREGINEDACKSPALGLQVDESTDIANQCLMILYLRLLRDGAFETVYWGLADVTDATGKGLSNTIVTFFKDQEVPIKKVSCLCTDGASAMTGDNAGCVKFVRDIIAHLISVHCVAHRQALACKDALDDNAAAQWFDKILHDIVNYHARSPKRAQALRQLQKELKVETLRLVKLASTRWLSRSEAIARLRKVWPALVREFKADRHDNDIAGVLADVIGKGKFVFYLLVFDDIIGMMARLSKLLQKTHVRCAELRRALKASKELLRQRYGRGKFVGPPAWLELGVADDEPVALYKGIEVDFTGWQGWTGEIYSFVETLTKSLDTRFPENEMDVIEALESVFEPDSYSGSADELCKEPLEVLLPFYGEGSPGHPAVVKKQQLREELPLLVVQLEQLKAKSALEGDARRREIYAEVLKDRQALPDAKRLLCIYLATCLSTVWCERGFSDLCLTKTKLQNRMNTCTTDDRLIITQHLKDKFENLDKIQGIVAKAMVKFGQRIKRCPARSHPAKAGRPKKVTAASTLSDVLEEAAREAGKLREEMDSDLSEEEEDDDEVDEESPEAEMARLLTTFGPFSAPTGYKVLEKPAESQKEWDAMAKTKTWWRGKKLAHIWDDGIGWHTVVFHDKQAKKYGFKYQGKLWYHPLIIENYGATRGWVVIARARG